MEKVKVKGKGYWHWAVMFLLAFASSLPLIQVFPLGDVFDSSLKISPDGFDWIIEGRALLSGVSEPWPVLRNTNLVLLSALDSVLGQTGFVFAAVNSLGLFLQGLALLSVLRVARHNEKTSFFVILGYYLLPLHFLSLYVLADTIAVGMLMLSVAFLIKYFESPGLHFLAAGALLSLGSGLFQTYGLAPILVFAVMHFARAIRSPQSKQVNLAVGTSVIASLSLFFLVRFTWLSLIPHNSVPSPEKLLKLTLDMLPFYSNLWPFLLAPMLLAIFLAFAGSRYRSSMRGSGSLSRPQTQFTLALGMGLLVLAVLYQWPESRFSYTYLGTLTMFVALLFAFETEASSEDTKEKSKAPIRFFAAASIVIFSLYAPNNPWQPKTGEFSLFGIWPVSLVDSSQYSWYIELREENCEPGAASKSTYEISKVFDDNGIVDPYTRNIGIFALSNCL